MSDKIAKKKKDVDSDGILIPAGHGGLITDENENDVLSGRGGRINSHPGNVQFRQLVATHKHNYLSKQTKKLDKVKIANRIVQTIRQLDPSGRFLKQDKASGKWIEIGDERARKKAGQAMREKADETRKELAQTERAPSASNSASMSLQQQHQQFAGGTTSANARLQSVSNPNGSSDFSGLSGSSLSGSMTSANGLSFNGSMQSLPLAQGLGGSALTGVSSFNTATMGNLGIGSSLNSSQGMGVSGNNGQHQQNLYYAQQLQQQQHQQQQHQQFGNQTSGGSFGMPFPNQGNPNAAGLYPQHHMNQLQQQQQQQQHQQFQQQQMNHQQQQYGKPLSPEQRTKNQQILTGNAVAFNREFNKMKNSDSSESRHHSLATSNISSMTGPVSGNSGVEGNSSSSMAGSVLSQLSNLSHAELLALAALQQQQQQQYPQQQQQQQYPQQQHPNAMTSVDETLEWNDQWDQSQVKSQSPPNAVVSRRKLFSQNRDHSFLPSKLNVADQAIAPLQNSNMDSDINASGLMKQSLETINQSGSIRNMSMGMADVASNRNVIITDQSLNDLMAMNISNSSIFNGSALPVHSSNQKLSVGGEKSEPAARPEPQPVQVSVDTDAGNFQGVIINIQSMARNNPQPSTRNAPANHFKRAGFQNQNNQMANNANGLPTVMDSMPPPSNMHAISELSTQVDQVSSGSTLSGPGTIPTAPTGPSRGMSRDMSGLSTGERSSSSGDMDMSISSRRSSVSTWMNNVHNFPGLRNLQSLQDMGGSRLRLFSDNSARSMMSDLSENMSALDLTMDNGQGLGLQRGNSRNSRSNSRRDAFDRANSNSNRRL
eukprot:CAMPEP_0194102466 /NCGR_PEP_ID=MMETSP0150-20130528/3068_1 /TAXON_ID=122233 /ORGANISM="Chaetoceros debilis, Strain MM31A-1" /LENGTH=826 /DNA_ID=CAMNT_0038789429 /DNA_START=215 /DNA_END=2695 /DNA_ORIENTATION=-